MSAGDFLRDHVQVIAVQVPAPRKVPVAYRCPECEQTWTVEDDPDEWAYGHDCEA